jgi:phytol kinase
MKLLLTVAVAAMVLVIAELLWRRKKLRGEPNRKLVHIIIGTFIAFWPYFLSWPQIRVLCLGGLLLVLLAGQTKHFHVGYDVNRRGHGDVFFPIGVGLASFISPSPLVFAIAILHLSLADGLAAVIGLRFGLGHQYKVRQYLKTLAGTLTFWLVSTIIVASTLLFSPDMLYWPLWPLLVWLPLAATLVENIAVAGLDNVAVPLLIIVVLRLAGIS